MWWVAVAYGGSLEDAESKGLVHVEPDAAVEAPTLILKGGTVLTAAGQRYEHGYVVLDKGKIAAVGEGAVPEVAGAKVVDVTGKVLTPGLIDTHSHLGVYAYPGGNGDDDGNEATNPVTSGVWAEHSIWPQDPGFELAIAGGVTTMEILPGSANLIGGRGVIVRSLPARGGRAMRLPGAPETVKMACGENPKRVYGEKNTAPSTRMGNLRGQREAFLKAQAYQRSWQDYDAALAKQADPDGKGKKKKNDQDDKPPPKPPDRDLDLETLVGVLEGKILPEVHCYRSDDMLSMLQVAQEFGFQVRSFHHATEAYKIRDVLAANHVAASVWSDWWGFKLEAYDAIPENAAMLATSGVKAIIHSDSAVGIQRLNQDAARAWYAGLHAGFEVTEDQALQWITANPAWALGIDGQVGTLEPGKRADVVVWDADPFSVYAHADQVFVDGALRYDRTRPQIWSDFTLGQPMASGQGEHAMIALWTLAVASAATCTVVTGAKLHLGTDAEPQVGAVVILDDRVAAVGAKIEGLSGSAYKGTACTAVDGAGKELAPGWIAVPTNLGLVEIDLENETRNDDARTDDDPVRAALYAADGYDPLSALIPVQRLGGVTTALTTPSGGFVSGMAAVVKLDGQTQASAVLDRDAALVMSVPTGSFAEGLQQIRELVADVRTYAARPTAFDGGRAPYKGASALDLQTLRPVVEGKIPVLVGADKASDLEALVRLQKELGLGLVVVGGAEAWLVADQLAAAKIPVVIDPMVYGPYGFDQIRGTRENAALLQKAGVPLILRATDDHNLRDLGSIAGNAVRDGLPHEAAIAAITATPAKVLGLTDRGRIAPGAVADLVLWSGDPLQLSSAVVAEWIAGRPIELRSRQTDLREKYRTLPGTPAPPLPVQ